MAHSMDLTQPRTLQKTVYSGIRLAQRVRWNVSAEFKPIFDVEGDPVLWDAPIGIKAKKAGVEVIAYERALEAFERMPVVKLAIVIKRAEGDFLVNWWKNMKKAEELAKSQVKENPLGAAKMLLQVEREKQMGIKRLVETGRMIDPAEYAKTPKRKKPKPRKPFVDENGFVNLEKLP